MARSKKTFTKSGEVRWVARYRDPEGRSKEKWFRLQVEADRFLRDVATQRDQGTWIDPAAGRITVASWFEMWSSARVHLRPSTSARDRSYIRIHIEAQLGSVPLRKLTPSVVRSWLQGRTAAGYAPATVRKAAQILRAGLDAAVFDRRIATNPARQLRLPVVPPTEMRFLTSDEVWRLANVMDSRFRALVVTAAFTGLRPGELRALRIGRLDMLRRRMQVEETATEIGGEVTFGPPKTRTSRRLLRMPNVVTEALAVHLERRTLEPSDLVFTAPMGGPMRKDNFRRRFWLPATALAGLSGLRVHDLRHTHAALLIAQNQHPKVIQERLGHSSIAVTLDLYGHLFDGLDEAAADALDEAYGNAHVGFSGG